MTNRSWLARRALHINCKSSLAGTKHWSPESPPYSSCWLAESLRAHWKQLAPAGRATEPPPQNKWLRPSGTAQLPLKREPRPRKNERATKGTTQSRNNDGLIRKRLRRKPND